MFHIVLFEPEIPPNTGNLIRLAANTGCHLHLIEPLGFSLEEKQLRRSGLDYHDMARVKVWPNLEAWLENGPHARVWVIETGGDQTYCDAAFEPGDALVFGPETRGLKDEQLQMLASTVLSLPMIEGNRSLNLSNCVTAVVYEAWRQNGFSA